MHTNKLLFEGIPPAAGLSGRASAFGNLGGLKPAAARHGASLAGISRVPRLSPGRPVTGWVRPRLSEGKPAGSGLPEFRGQVKEDLERV